MPVINIQLKGIDVNRDDFKETTRLKNINNNVLVKDIREQKINIGGPRNSLVFTFVFKSDYFLEKPKNKKFGTLEIIGDVFYIDDEKEMKSIMQEWKKKKKIKEPVLIQVLQSAFDVAKIEAIYMSRKVLLPSPIELPKVRPPNQSQGYIG